MEETKETNETAVFYLEKENVNKYAKRILLTAVDPGANIVINPLIKKLKQDERCGTIGFITEGVALKKFIAENHSGFKQLRTENAPVLYDILSMAKENPLDIAVLSLTAKDGPESVGFFAESSFGAKRIYIIFDAWGSGHRTLRQCVEKIERIDGVFCNDELAKDVILSEFPEFNPDKVYPTGTPQIDSLDLEHADELAAEGRKKLGIADDEFTVLYLDDVSSDYKMLSEVHNVYFDPFIIEKTWEKTASALINLANENPEKKFVLASRPHPRDLGRELYKQIPESLPKNLRLVDASGDTAKVTINEACYAVDVISSIFGTENLKAPLRNKQGIFLGYDDRGLGADVLKLFYEPKIIEVMKKNPYIKIVSSSENFKDYLEKLSFDITKRQLPQKASEPYIDSATKILNKIFETKN